MDFYRGRGLSWNDITDDGKNECVLYGNLYTDYGMVISKIKYKTNVNKDSMVLSKFGDVLIPSSDTTPTGLARATSIDKSDVILGGDINVLRPKKDNGDFISYSINVKRTELIKRIKGTTVRHLNNSDIEDLEIRIAPNIDEQIKISKILTKIDNLITLHQSKYDKLVNVKKALLEKMFPKEGKNVPEIRFKGFTDTWEQRKLNDVYTFSQGMQVEIENQAFDKKDNMEQFLRIIDITQSNEPPRYIYNKSGKGHVEKDDIFFVRYGAVGTIGYGYTGTIANNLFKLSTSEKYDNNFMFQQFSNGNFNKKLVEMSASTSMPAINFTALKNLDFFITTNDEQKEIGSFFSKLDNLITLHQHKLEKLQNIKKSLLNKMFV